MEWVWEFQLTNRTLEMLDIPYYIRNRVNALCYCMIMSDVTFVDNQRQDNCVCWPGYRQENQGIVVQFWGGQQVYLFYRASRLALKATYLPMQCRPRAISDVGKAASKYSAEIKNKWRNTSTPICVYGVHKHNSYFHRKVQALRVECKRKNINCSKHNAWREQRHMWG